MKKFMLCLIASFIVTGCLAAYIFAGANPAESSRAGGETGKGNGEESGGRPAIQIVATHFPAYDWVMNILGENPAGAQVTMLLDQGVDLHSFQPTVEDILKISACDLFVYVGGESDAWVDDALQEAKNQDMTAISLMDVLGDSAKEEETVEGMQAERSGHDHEQDADEPGSGHGQKADEPSPGPADDKDAAEYDEHVWLSLRNAAAFVQAISDAIRAIDPEHANLYKDNTAAYLAKLDALDAQYRAAVDSAALHTLLFGDRFPFRYLVDDYGLDYYAAFAGCSAETEASFETIIFLSRKADELSLPAVLTIEGSDRRIADTIARNTQSENLPVLSLNSMQSVTAEDLQNGASYLSIMENNLSVLKEALNGTVPE